MWGGRGYVGLGVLGVGVVCCGGELFVGVGLCLWGFLGLVVGDVDFGLGCCFCFGLVVSLLSWVVSLSEVGLFFWCSYFGFRFFFSWF